MADQKQINELLQDSWCASSTLNNKGLIQSNKPKKQQESQDYSYDNEFQSYDESRRTNQFHQSRDEISYRKKQNKALIQIPEQPSKQKRTKKVYQQTQKIQSVQKIPKSGISGVDKIHLAHNYARLQERQRELLLTTLSEDNKTLKRQLLQKDKQLNNLSNKYKILLNEKTQTNATVREQALQKKVTVLTTKLERLENLHRIQTQRNKYKTKIRKQPQNFIPEEQALRRQQQLLDLVEKLKARLLQSDQNLLVLQKKMNEQLQHNDQMHRKMRRVEQLQYRIQKMNSQAQSDRSLIEILKQKIKEGQHKLKQEKDNVMKLKATIRRIEIGGQTNSDIIQQLKATKKQKQELEKTLRELSANVLFNIKNSTNNRNNSVEKLEGLEIG